MGRDSAKAAGILHVCMINKELFVLLGMRRPEAGLAEQWSNLGGKAEPGETLAAAAKREVLEESLGFAPVDLDLQHQPSFDLELDNTAISLYRMYVCLSPAFDLVSLNTLCQYATGHFQEYRSYRWVAWSELIESITSSQAVSTWDGIIPRKEIIVLNKDVAAMFAKEDLQKHLSDYAKADFTRNSIEAHRAQIALTTVSRFRFLTDIAQTKEPEPVDDSHLLEAPCLSERHMQAILGVKPSLSLTDQLKATLAKQTLSKQGYDGALVKNLAELIINERAAEKKGQQTFYHAVPSHIALVYELLSLVYSQLKYESKSQFRLPDVLQNQFDSLQQMIHHFASHHSGGDAISNYSVGFQRLFIAVNVCLFGSFDQETSSSTHLFATNTAATEVDIFSERGLLFTTFMQLGLSKEQSLAFVSVMQGLHEEKAIHRGGRLYQIAIDANRVDELAYACVNGGKQLEGKPLLSTCLNLKTLAEFNKGDKALQARVAANLLGDSHGINTHYVDRSRSHQAEINAVLSPIASSISQAILDFVLVENASLVMPAKRIFDWQTDTLNLTLALSPEAILDRMIHSEQYYRIAWFLRTFPDYLKHNNDAINALSSHPFLIACLDNNLPEVYQDLVALGVSATRTDNLGRSLYHALAPFPDLLIKALAKNPLEAQQACIRAKDNAGQSVVHACAAYVESMRYMVSLLDQNDKALDEKDCQGQTIYHYAVPSLAGLEYLAELKDQSLSQALAYTEDEEGLTVFHRLTKYTAECCSVIDTLPVAELLALLALKNKAGHSVLTYFIRDIAFIRKVIQRLSAKQLWDALNEEKLQQPSLLHHCADRSPEGLSLILNHLPDDKVIKAATLYNLGFISRDVFSTSFAKLENLKIIIDRLPVDGLDKVMVWQSFMGRTSFELAIPYADSFIYLVEQCGKTPKEILLSSPSPSVGSTETTALFFQTPRNPALFDWAVTALQAQGENDIFYRLDAGGNNLLHLTAPFSDSLSKAMGVFSPQQRYELLQGKNKQENTPFHLSVNNIDSFCCLVDGVKSIDSLYDLLMIENKEGLNVMHLIADKPMHLVALFSHFEGRPDVLYKLLTSKDKNGNNGFNYCLKNTASREKALNFFSHYEQTEWESDICPPNDYRQTAIHSCNDIKTFKALVSNVSKDYLKALLNDDQAPLLHFCSALQIRYLFSRVIVAEEEQRSLLLKRNSAGNSLLYTESKEKIQFLIACLNQYLSQDELADFILNENSNGQRCLNNCSVESVPELFQHLSTVQKKAVILGGANQPGILYSKSYIGPVRLKKLLQVLTKCGISDNNIDIKAFMDKRAIHFDVACKLFDWLGPNYRLFDYYHQQVLNSELFFTACYFKPELAKFLIDAYALDKEKCQAVLMKTNKYGNSLIKKALYSHNNEGVFEKLLTLYSNEQLVALIKHKDNDGETIFHAATEANLHNIRALLSVVSQQKTYTYRDLITPSVAGSLLAIEDKSKLLNQLRDTLNQSHCRRVVSHFFCSVGDAAATAAQVAHRAAEEGQTEEPKPPPALDN